MRLRRTKSYCAVFKRAVFDHAVVCCIAFALGGASLPASAQVLQWLDQALSGRSSRSSISQARANNESADRNARSRLRDGRPVENRRMMPDGSGADNQPRDKRGRMSPEDSQQLRRDIRDAGRDIYPERPRGQGREGRGRRNARD